MKYFIDSYSWIAYLNGSLGGQKVRDILIGNNEVYTLSLNVAEVISRIKRMGGNTDLVYKAITLNSKIIPVDQETAKQAGLFHAEIRKKIKDFGLVDSIILIISKNLNLKIVTGDEHFRGMKKIIFIN